MTFWIQTWKIKDLQNRVNTTVIGEGHGNTLQYSCLENPHGQKSLEGYSPWGRTESDTTEVT